MVQKQGGYHNPKKRNNKKKTTHSHREWQEQSPQQSKGNSRIRLLKEKVVWVEGECQLGRVRKLCYCLMTPLITTGNAYFFSCLNSLCYPSDQVQNRETILNPALREQKFIYCEMKGKGTQGGINVTVGDGVVGWRWEEDGLLVCPCSPQVGHPFSKLWILIQAAKVPLVQNSCLQYTSLEFSQSMSLLKYREKQNKNAVHTKPINCMRTRYWVHPFSLALWSSVTYLPQHSFSQRRLLVGLLCFFCCFCFAFVSLTSVIPVTVHLLKFHVSV